MAALNRTFALSKVIGKEEAIVEAEKLNFTGNHLYHSLLGYLFTALDIDKALKHYEQALTFAKTENDKATIINKINSLKAGKQCLS